MVESTDGAKMMYLIKRRSGVSREELVAHWYANHMPAVIQGQKESALRGRQFARRYIATLFDENERGERPWDGVAQLWYPSALPKPQTPFGTVPSDTFQEKAMPYLPWATREYVVMEGSENLNTDPLTLNAPYPMTRSGFYKITFLVAVVHGTDYEDLFAHWLNVHVPNVKSVMEQVGGFRYVVSHSIDPSDEPFAGMAELYFHEPEGWHAWRSTIKADGMERFTDSSSMVISPTTTEMVGIP